MGREKMVKLESMTRKSLSFAFVGLFFSGCSTASLQPRAPTDGDTSRCVAEHVVLASPDLERQLSALKSKSFNEIEAMAPAKFATIHQRGKSDPNYITEERLLASGGELWKVRSFLYHQFRLTELFAGTGFTQRADGARGAAEFVMLNRALRDLADARIINLD